MSVTIRKMTNAEFEVFCQWSIEQNTRELMEERKLSRDEAHKQSVKEVSEMLPDGLHTEHNHLISILEPDSSETAGFVWVIFEENDGRKQSFICDFAIWDTKRRKGYGTAALYLTEQFAIDEGCRESVLFVADRNCAAKALYQKCGYHVLRQAGYGNYMIKQLL